MELQYKEIGYVKAVKDCIVTIDGLYKCIYGQLIKFGYETMGMVRAGPKNGIHLSDGSTKVGSGASGAGFDWV